MSTGNPSSVTAYLAVNGDDQTAKLDDPTHPFKTLNAARAALTPFRETKTVKVVDLGYAPLTPTPKTTP